jgi:mannosyl-3-phosphoglycerate phosphatase
MNTSCSIIFTDLDGSLLDHSSYSYAAARPALERIGALGIPLILSTSKTLAETARLAEELQLNHPLIVENGGALCLPPGLFSGTVSPDLTEQHGHRIKPLSLSYRQILRFIGKMRRQHGFRLRGFNDMPVAEIAAHTGLDCEAAHNARQRLSSEPFQWLDGAAAFEDFRKESRMRNLHITRGGRFWHLMGPQSKASALQQLLALYQGAGQRFDTVIALGDSDNDRQMLCVADIAVAIKSHQGGHVNAQGVRQSLRTEHPGPTGWNQAVLQLLQHLPPTPN